MKFWSKLFTFSSQTNDLSFKDNLKAFQYLPPFLKMVWETHPGMASANVLLRLLQSAIPVTMLYIGKLIIDEVILLQDQSTELSPVLITYLVSELALVIIGALLSRLVNLFDALLGDLFSNKSSLVIMEHAARLDLPQLEDATFYDKLARARRQTTGRVMLMSSLLSQAQDLVTIGFLAAGMIAFNPWLILLLALAVVPSFISETHFNQRSYSLARSWTPERRELDYLRYIGANDDTAKEIKIFGLAHFLRDRFDTVADKYYQANRKIAIQRVIWGMLFNTFGDIGYYVAYVVIILQTLSGQLSIGDLTFLAGAFNRLRRLMQGVLLRFSGIAQNALYLQDYFDFLKIEPHIVSGSGALPFPVEIKQGFQFHNVSFKYPNSDKYAVRNLSFTLHPREKLALVGENGAGKTTLVKLIARLYDPSEGQITLEGQDLRRYDLSQLRNAVGVIFQDYVRFQMTVSDNIAVGQIEDKDNKGKIEDAAVQSLADTVIRKLGKGYDQMLGKRFKGGVELSGGEWQKVALGRAYMRSAQLLILDEPTAALDARAEYEVFERFADLTIDKMAFIISHRFSTVRMADRILVLQQGELQEIGSHEELLQKQGVYAELFQLQAQGYQ